MESLFQLRHPALYAKNTKLEQSQDIGKTGYVQLNHKKLESLESISIEFLSVPIFVNKIILYRNPLIQTAVLVYSDIFLKFYVRFFKA